MSLTDHFHPATLGFTILNPSHHTLLLGYFTYHIYIYSSGTYCTLHVSHKDAPGKGMGLLGFEMRTMAHFFEYTEISLYHDLESSGVLMNYIDTVRRRYIIDEVLSDLS